MKVEYCTNYNGWDLNVGSDVIKESFTISDLEEELVDFTYDLCDDEGYFLQDEFTDDDQIKVIKSIIHEFYPECGEIVIEYDNFSS